MERSAHKNATKALRASGTLKTRSTRRVEENGQFLVASTCRYYFYQIVN